MKQYIYFSAFFIGLMTMLYFSVKTGNAQMRAHRRSFFSECMQDHKEYECKTLYYLYRRA